MEKTGVHVTPAWGDLATTKNKQKVLAFEGGPHSCVPLNLLGGRKGKCGHTIYRKRRAGGSFLLGSALSLHWQRGSIPGLPRSLRNLTTWLTPLLGTKSLNFATLHPDCVKNKPSGFCWPPSSRKRSTVWWRGQRAHPLTRRLTGPWVWQRPIFPRFNYTFHSDVLTPIFAPGFPDRALDRVSAQKPFFNFSFVWHLESWEPSKPASHDLVALKVLPLRVPVLLHFITSNGSEGNTLATRGGKPSLPNHAVNQVYFLPSPCLRMTALPLCL